VSNGSIEEILNVLFPLGGVVALTKARKTWITAIIIAVVACMGELASHLVATDLHEVLKPYAWITWIVFALSVLIAVFAAIRETRGKTGDTSPVQAESKASRFVAVSGNVIGVVNTGDSNSIVQVRPEPADERSD
jgi:hypothetical protein